MRRYHARLLVVSMVVWMVACSSESAETSKDSIPEVGGPDGSTVDQIGPGDVSGDASSQEDGMAAGDVVQDLTGDAPGGDTADTADGDTVEPYPGLPSALPFELVRPSEGEPLSDEEVTAFTKDLVAFWKETDYFTWLYETSLGVDASTGYPDYLFWWDNVTAKKEGDKVTFYTDESGHGHNILEQQGLVLSQVTAGYLLTKDPAMATLATQYWKGIVAMMKGMVYDDDDPYPYVMSRNIVTLGHEYTLPSGKAKAVDYSLWYSYDEGWNAKRVLYEHNPYWGEVWVTTTRSKDDIPFLLRAAAWLPYIVAVAEDEELVAAAGEALEYLEGFCTQVSELGYYIPTKDDNGELYIADLDLASFNDFNVIYPEAECAPKLVMNLVAYGDPKEIACGSAYGSEYETFAGAINYYNYSIVDHFHMDAVLWALLGGYDDTAKALLEGFVERMDTYTAEDTMEPGAQKAAWGRDMAQLLLYGAAIGMPLSWKEARYIHGYLTAAVSHYEEFERWDMWDESVPDGEYSYKGGYRPLREDEYVRISDIAFVLEYCFSPFKNPSGVSFIDCSVVQDIASW